METWNRCFVSGILIIWIFCWTSNANPVLDSERSIREVKHFEDPIVPQYSVENENTRLSESGGDRSLSVEHNMMLYRSVFTLSLKLLTVFFITRLLTFALQSTGVVRPIVIPEPVYYPVDVQNAGWVQQQPVAVVPAQSAEVQTERPGTSTGILVTTGPWAAPAAGGWAAAATNPRPHYVAPGPRFRLGNLFRRYPPRGHPMGHMHHNMGVETHLRETHSHVLVHPDGTHTKVPVAKAPAAASSSEVVAQASNVKPVSSSSTSAPPAAESVSIAETASSAPTSTRRIFREKQYTDWQLHYNPGTRSLS